MPALDTIHPALRPIHPLIPDDPRLACRCASPLSPDTPCAFRATAEDGLCGTCRNGCTRITLTELSTGQIEHHSHVRVPHWVDRD
jgi:hypothetical protein